VGRACATSGLKNRRNSHEENKLIIVSHPRTRPWVKRIIRDDNTVSIIYHERSMNVASKYIYPPIFKVFFFFYRHLNSISKSIPCSGVFREDFLDVDRVDFDVVDTRSFRNDYPFGS